MIPVHVMEAEQFLMIKTEHACYSRCHMQMDVTYSILMLLLY